ncbi:class I SAM-dependent methyltransferase [bacterium]|nr:class I SAM-dependent methyltransferase [bacterium]
MANRYPGRSNALVLGAGDGTHCRLLVDLGIARNVKAFDINEVFVQAARRDYERLKYPIAYLAEDLHTFTWDGLDYDLCLAVDSLRHVINVERVLRETSRALRDRSGVLVCQEYVGPRYVEIPESTRSAARRILRRLPERLRLTPDGCVMKQPVFHNRWMIQQHSPFEAIRSDRILEAVRKEFRMEHLAEQGGGLLLALLNPIIHNFDPRDEEANGWLRTILDEDLRLTRTGEIPNCLAFLIAHA